MSRILTFLGVALVIVVSIYMQDLAIRLLGPNSSMWALIADITWPVDGDVWAERTYTAITVWFIWIIRVGAVAAGFYREFLGQKVTAQTPAGVRR